MSDSFARKSAGTFLIQLTQIAAQAAAVILVTHVTGAPGQGTFVLFVSLVTLSTTAANFGISWAGVHLLAREHSADHSMPATIFTASLVSGLASDLAIAGAYLSFAATVFRGVNVEALWVVMTVTPVVHCAGALAWIMLGLNRPRAFALLSAVEFIVTLLVQLLLASVGRLTATTALAAWGVGAAVSLALGYRVTAKYVRIKVGITPECLSRLVRFGMRGYVANLTMFLNYRLDTVLVTALMSVTSLGIYSVAVVMSESLWYLPNSIATVLFPHVSGIGTAAAATTPALCRMTLLVSAVSALVLAVGAHGILVLVFPPAMQAALPAIWCLLPGMVALGLTKVLSSYLAGIGKPSYATVIGVTTVPITIILNLILIPRYGIAGAAITSSAVYLVAMIMALTFFLHESGLSLDEVLIVRAADFRLVRDAVPRLLAGRSETGPPGAGV